MAGTTGEHDWYVSGVFSMSFINLNDTFGDYVGRAELVPKVNAAEDTLIPSDTEIDNHSGRHEDGGDDEMSVQGLSGVLVEKQKPEIHHSSHEDGGDDEMSVQGLSGVLVEKQKPEIHHSSHEDGGADEISKLGGIITFPDQSAFRVYRDNEQNITGGTWATVRFNSYEYDIQSEFETGNDQFVTTKSGIYLFSGLVTLNVAAAGDGLLLEIRKNEITNAILKKAAPSSYYHSLFVVVIMQLVAGDKVDMRVKNGSNDDIIVHGSNSTFLSGIKIA